MDSNVSQEPESQFRYEPRQKEKGREEVSQEGVSGKVHGFKTGPPVKKRIIDGNAEQQELNPDKVKRMKISGPCT